MSTCPPVFPTAMDNDVVVMVVDCPCWRMAVAEVAVGKKAIDDWLGLVVVVDATKEEEVAALVVGDGLLQVLTKALTTIPANGLVVCCD